MWLFVAVLLVSGCGGLPSDPYRSESHVLPDTATTPLGRASSKLRQTHPSDNSFRPLASGVDALLTRLALADLAERSLDVQYYIWHDDQTGRYLAQALLHAADRGVRVRVLLDDVGTRANDDTLLALDSHPNIEIRLFNPAASRSFRGLNMLGDFSRLNRRMHNKSFIADNQAAVVGGRNIGDEYFDASDEVAFGDLDVLMMGAVVPQVSKAFDHFWNAPQSVSIKALAGDQTTDYAANLAALRTQLNAFIEAHRDSPYVNKASARLLEQWQNGVDGSGAYWGQARLLYDDPDKVTRAPDDADGHLLPQFGNIPTAVNHELLIVSPYFVPGKKGLLWLQAMTARGVRVTVLTNSLAATDVTAVHSGYQHYRDELLTAGVRLYEMRPDAIDKQFAPHKKTAFIGSSRASLHAKTFVLDRQAIFIGSLNLDPRSVELNTEIGVMCESPALAEAVARTVEKQLDLVAWRIDREVDESGRSHIVWNETNPDGSHQQYTTDPMASVWRRMSAWFMALLPLESQL